MQSSDESLRDLLLQLSPSARDKLRTVLIRDDRDEIASELLRYGDANGDGWADVIDTCRCIRMCGERRADVGRDLRCELAPVSSRQRCPGHEYHPRPFGAYSSIRFRSLIPQTFQRICLLGRTKWRGTLEWPRCPRGGRH